MPDLESQQVHRGDATASTGRARTGDGVVDVGIAVAGDADASPDKTSPEHLMAAALAACLQQALGIAVSSQDGHAEPTVDATVTLESGGEAGYTATFELVVSGLDAGSADQTLQQARQLCPFTKALDSSRLTVRTA